MILLYMAIPPLPYKYSQLTTRISYEESNKIIAKANEKTMHWGQLKLFLSELLFLSMFSKRPYTVLYVGAAEGTHTAKLADLFPQNTFILYDPRKFVIESRPNITIQNKLFTDEEAAKYVNKGKDILFISDIRILDYGKAKVHYGEDSDEMIYKDMEYQMDWCKLIRPKVALLKFRTLYIQEKFRYLTGSIYLQHYSPISTETRLLTKDYDTLTTYNSKEFDERMAYYNCCIRPKQKSSRWRQVMDKLGLKNNVDAAMMLYIIEYYLVKTKKLPKNKSKTQVIELFEDIGRFFKRMNYEKYKNMFEKEKAFTISNL